MFGVHATAVIESGAHVPDGVDIGPFAYVGPQARLGERVKLGPRATILGETHLGDDVEIHTGAVLGDLPQILDLKGGDIGRLEIGPRTVVREYATLHAGWTPGGGLTRIGADCLLMGGVHFGHDCRIGDHCVIANNVAAGGHSVIGDHVWIGGQAAMHQYTRIGDHAMVGGGSILVGDVIPFGLTAGNHARLEGLNLVGLKRRGFPRETVNALRKAFKGLFRSKGPFADRIARVDAEQGDEPHVAMLLDFIRADAKRSLCLPG